MLFTHNSYTATRQQFATVKVTEIRFTSSGMIWVGTVNGFIQLNSDYEALEEQLQDQPRNWRPKPGCRLRCSVLGNLTLADESLFVDHKIPTSSYKGYLPFVAYHHLQVADGPYSPLFDNQEYRLDFDGRNMPCRYMNVANLHVAKDLVALHAGKTKLCIPLHRLELDTIRGFDSQEGNFGHSQLIVSHTGRFHLFPLRQFPINNNRTIPEPRISYDLRQALHLVLEQGCAVRRLSWPSDAPSIQPGAPPRHMYGPDSGDPDWIVVPRDAIQSGKYDRCMDKVREHGFIAYRTQWSADRWIYMVASALYDFSTGMVYTPTAEDREAGDWLTTRSTRRIVTGL